MFSKLTGATFALSLLAQGMAQSSIATEIPAAEASALATIVEDDPNSIPAAKKGGGTSPPLALYQKPLPIPDVAVPKQ